MRSILFFHNNNDYTGSTRVLANVISSEYADKEVHIEGISFGVAKCSDDRFLATSLPWSSDSYTVSSSCSIAGIFSHFDLWLVL